MSEKVYAEEGLIVATNRGIKFKKLRYDKGKGWISTAKIQAGE